jgi:hypothetical protein
MSDEELEKASSTSSRFSVAFFYRITEEPQSPTSRSALTDTTPSANGWTIPTLISTSRIFLLSPIVSLFFGA